MKLEIRPATEHVPSFSPQEFQTYLSASCFHRYVTLSLLSFQSPLGRVIKLNGKMRMIVRDESLSGAGTNLWHQNPFLGSLHWQEPAPGSVAGLQEASVHSCLKITPTTTFLCC